MDVTVITPSIGTPQLERAVRSVLRQSIPVRHVVVVDGANYEHHAGYHAERGANGPTDRLVVTTLPDNTGKYRGETWYGHRVYAYFAQLVDADFIAFLDEDNEYEPNHVETLVERAAKHGFSWSYRSIWYDGKVLGRDLQESIGVQNQFGYSLTDTSCWMFRQDHVINTLAIAGGWGADRILTAHMIERWGTQNFLAACTGQHSMRYHAPDRLLDFFRSIAG